MKTTLIALAFLTLLSACGKNGAPAAAPSIVGTWKWNDVRSDGNTVVEYMTLKADGSCHDQLSQSNGSNDEFDCTYTFDGANFTISAAPGGTPWVSHEKATFTDQNTLVTSDVQVPPVLATKTFTRQ